MSGTFNGHILVDKLAKLNNSQQSIETLSHWCIFHRNKARQVVEIWNKQFHCTRWEKQVPFLYLANDILQNSRRKGLEFVTEFWKVLPDALNNVLENGDEFGRNTVLRLVNIWEERKVFGSRGKILKDELLGRNPEGRNRNENFTNYKLKRRGGDGILEKLISDYEHLYDGPVDEEALFGKCQTAISCVENVEKEIGSDFKLGSLSGSRVLEELEEQLSMLRECIEQLKALESSRITLVSHLREAIHEQEFKLEQVRNQLKITQSRYEQVGSICQQSLSGNLGKMPPEQRLREASEAPPSYTAEAPSSTGDREQSAPVRYNHQEHFNDKAPRTEEEQQKTAAAAVAAKLVASTSSAQMLSFVLSSLASEGVIGPAAKEDSSSGDRKRPRLENVTSPYIPPHSQPSLPPFPHPDTLYQPTLPQPSSSPLAHPGSTHQPQMLPPTPPMAIPPPATQFMQVAGSMTGVPYSYGSALPPQRPPPFPGFAMINSPPFPGLQNPFQGFQSPEGANLFNHSSVPVTPPQISRP